MRTSKERRHLTEKVKQKRIRKWSQPNKGIGQEKHKGMMRKTHFGCGCGMCKPWKHGFENPMKISDQKRSYHNEYKEYEQNTDRWYEYEQETMYNNDWFYFRSLVSGTYGGKLAHMLYKLGIVDRVLRDEIAKQYAMKPNKDGALGA